MSHVVSVFTHCPELDEILQHGGSDEHAVNHGVGQEQDEVFIIGEAHAVVNPESVKTDQMKGRGRVRADSGTIQPHPLNWP